jgi:predicted enzyme related to lactoylglutathione lyase
MRLNRAMIFVKDLHRMAAFYGGTMQMELIDDSRTDSWVEFDAGGIRLALHAIPSHIAENIEITQPPHAREGNPVKLIFEVDDLEARISSLESEGATIVQRPWGACDIIDPEGNIFQIGSSTKSNQTGSK